jgi:hypothetical protein
VSSAAIQQRMVPVVVGAVTAIATLWFAARFRAETEGGAVLVAVASGTCGWGATSLGPDWRPLSTIDRASRGLFFGLLLYCVLRGLLLRSADATPARVNVGGLGAICFLVGLGQAPRHPSLSIVTRIAHSAVAVALVILFFQGCIGLLQ